MPGCDRLAEHLFAMQPQRAPISLGDLREAIQISQILLPVEPMLLAIVLVQASRLLIGEIESADETPVAPMHSPLQRQPAQANRLAAEPSERLHPRFSPDARQPRCDTETRGMRTGALRNCPLEVDRIHL